MNLKEYIDLAFQVIKSNISESETSITAARLGMLLRQSNSGGDWTTHGFRSLKDLLLSMQEQGLVQTGDSAKGAFAVWPVENNFALNAPPSPPTYNPLRKPFWVAFVVDQPRGRRFFNRVTYQIRMGLSEPLSPADEWVEIFPISNETQVRWAREFLKDKKVEHRADLGGALDDPEWYRRFPELLRELDPLLARDWNRRRSILVSESIETWCATHSINPAIAFQSAATKNCQKQAGISPGAPRPTFAYRSPRDRVLAALAKMPTEFLLEIPIPGKYLLEEEIAATSARTAN